MAHFEGFWGPVVGGFVLKWGQNVGHKLYFRGLGVDLFCTEKGLN